MAVRFALALLLCTPATILAQKPDAPIGQDPALNWAQRMFERQNVDFGIVARGAECKTHLKVKNLYQETIFITNVSTSCGCSAAKPSSNQILSGQEAYIEISMDTVRFMREKTSAALVTLSEPTKGLSLEVRIPLKVYIRTDVVFSPGVVSFGAIEQNAGGERKVTVAYAGRADWKIRDVKSPKPYLTAKAVETSRSPNGTVNYDLHVNLTADAPVGAIRETLTLITDDQNNAQVPLPVDARIESEFSIQPEVVALGVVTAGQSKTLNVVIRGRKPFRIEKLEAGTPGSGFQTKLSLPSEEKAVHVVPLMFTAADQAGEINEVFSVNVAGRSEPLTFKAIGRVQSSGPTPTKP